MQQITTGCDLPESYNLNLSNFALFLSVMKNKRAYECLLSIIMNEDSFQLQEVKVEQVVLNKIGKRAIRLDAWAVDTSNRQFNTEMQNDTNHDDIRKRSRYYQGLLDSPVLKSGKNIRYKYLPSTVIIFITQEDIFSQGLAMYTFTEQCEEIQGLHLEDGTKKIFLNMNSKKGRPELISLLQYIKKSELKNPEIIVEDERIVTLDRIVQEVKQSEEWEGVKMDLIEFGVARGEEKQIIIQVCKKLRKGKPIQVIAAELEENEGTIQEISEAAEPFAPEYDYADVYNAFQEKRNKKD